MSKRTLVAILALASMVSVARAQDMAVTVCIMDTKLKNNPNYYMLPNSGSRLVCDQFQANARPTLPDMYRLGWRLIQVVHPDVRVVGANKAASPMLYFERVNAPAEANKSSDKKKSSKKESGSSIW